VINVPASIRPGTVHAVESVGAMGPDLQANPIVAAR
jgi:hypothetical protein